ncbi:MAG: NADH-quinone oxidoreductase subunit N [Bacteroidota bacterium]
MRLEDFLLMRHELLLTLLLVVVLFTEVITSEDNKLMIRPLTLVLFLIVTLVGFCPAPTGILFGGMYKSSELQILMKNVLNIGVFIVFLQSARWLKHEDNHNKVAEFYILMLSTLIGMNFMISSGDFLMFYLGLELATIPVAALAAYDRYSNKSSEAGIKLLLSSALSSGILLYGISMLYGTIGSIYFTQVSAAYTGSPLQVLAFIFFFTGMAFKISIVPFHLWTADVYEGAPVNVTSYLSVISKGAAVFILTIVLYTVFGSIKPLWQDVIWVTSVLTMTIGNLFAMRQKNLKRFLAFSSISQAGFIIIGVIGGNIIGMTSVVYYILVYIFSNLGAFGVVSAVSVATNGKENMDDYDGLYNTNPALALTMTLALFSLAGIPPVAGFFGKFFLFTAAAKEGFYWLLTIALLNTIISLYYYLLVVKAMFINKSDEPIAYFKSDFYTKLGLAICVAGMFIVGFASPIWEYFQSLSFGVM